MPKEMLINVSEGEECRIALLEDGKLEELYMERTSSTSHVGNIYKGKVTNVEASIQAAFVDFGLGRNGFLHISDVMPTYFGQKGEDIVETVGKKMSRRDRPPIQRRLRRGDEIVVQIIKEGIGTKGPTLSTYLSIPGRILVMMPGMGKMGVSRKIEDDGERRRLRQILDGLKPPKDVGFIIRTAGVDKSKLEIERDLKYLTRLWETLVKRRDSGPGAMELYTEGDLVARTVRDVFTADVDRIIVDNADVAERVKDVIKLSSPRTRNKVETYEEPVPLFHKFGIEREIELMYSRHVPLPSGGSLVIDSTEAIVAIDVNSGKFRDHSDAETTAFKTDMEAADEIARQLRLRDLGGVIIVDFIDLRFERHRIQLEERLAGHLKNDRAKTKMLRMSQFGIVEMTRQRMRPSYKRAVYFDCPHCKGAGLVKTPESMSLDVMRRLAMAINDQKVVRAELSVCNDVAFYLQNKKRRSIAELEDRFNKRVLIRTDPKLGLDEMKLELFDSRDGLVMLDQLGTIAQPPHRSQLATRPYPPKDGGRGAQGGRGDSRRQPASDTRRPPQGRPRDDDEMDERLDLDRDEDYGDERDDQSLGDREDNQRQDRDRGGRQQGGRQERPDNRGGRPVGRDNRPAARDDNRGPRDESHDDYDDHQDTHEEDEVDPRNVRNDARGGRPDVRGPRNDNRGGRNDQPAQRDNSRGRDDAPPMRDNTRGRENPPQSRDNARGRDNLPPRDNVRGGRNDINAPRDNRGGRDEGRQQQRPPQRPLPPRGQPNLPPPARAGNYDAPPIAGDEEGHFDEENFDAPGITPGAFDQQGEGDGGPRRRRRRRGRRGRGRGGRTNEGQPLQQGDRPDDQHLDIGAAPQATPGDAGFESEYEVDDGPARNSGRYDERDHVYDNEADEEGGHRSDAIVEEPTIESDAIGRTFPETVQNEATGVQLQDPTSAGDAPAAEGEETEADGTGPRRRRRRRGGRGRGRGGKAAAANATEETSDEAADDIAEAESPSPEVEKAAPAKRGARPSKARKPRETKAAREAREAAEAEQPPAPVEKPVRASRARIAAPDAVVRTGSADKHLAEDEPIAEEPAPRPRSFRDLDAIPEEFD